MTMRQTKHRRLNTRFMRLYFKFMKQHRLRHAAIVAATKGANQ